ncbi:GDSL esterase/lipase At5g14450-like [Euphorbia lathyris]|uniref:GDSL esterase/lipase At5g14450-like n=1 Tax=Euphorbia lathyris TaxID=212925 RepID=UPI003313DAAD
MDSASAIASLSTFIDKRKSRSRIIRTIAIALTIAIVLLSFPFFNFSPAASQLPLLFNFGDSNSDTGGYSASFHRLPSPHGDTYFGRPSGRFSDGRLIIDFIAEKLGIPYLNAYLDSISSDFTHGANFAASGATIQPGNGKLLDANFNPISLNIQILEFQQFKDRTIELYQQDRSLWRRKGLPRPEDFSKALYTLDCGQNDLDFWLETMMDEQKVVASIPNIINQFALAIKELFQEGARKFWIHNTGPIGCLPIIVIVHPPKPGNVDSAGCVKSYNEVAQVFNKKLNQTISKLRTDLSDAVHILVDIYSAKYSLISEAKKNGFEDPLGCCCGQFGDYRVDCGTTTELVNGTEVYGAACSDPSKRISWDGIHYTEAANKLVANRTMDGSLSDPPLPLIEACAQPIHSTTFLRGYHNDKRKVFVS